MAKLHSLTELCSLRVSVEMYVTLKALCSGSTVTALALRSTTAVTHHGVLLVVRLTSQRSALALEETAQPTTGAV